MSILELTRLIRSNLLRMKFRVLMTSAGVFIGTTAVVLLLSLGAGLQRSVIDSFGNIGDLTTLTVSSRSDIFGGQPGLAASDDPVLNDAAIRDFANIPGVTAASPQLRLQANAELKLNRATAFSNIVGIDTSQVRTFDFEMESG
ncbi:MAG: ABC transporter permease, partial [Chloroflexota bacterium]